MTPDEFVDQLAPAARAFRRSSGIPASFTLAQAALESGWGKAAPGFNLFGIKADKSWSGPTVTFATHENMGCQRVGITDKFRAYPSWLDCLNDRAQFFLKNPRYAKCFRETTGEGWARAVAAAGYATDPDYAEKLISTIRAHHLTRFDQP